MRTKGRHLPVQLPKCGHGSQSHSFNRGADALKEHVVELHHTQLRSIRRLKISLLD